MMSDPLVEAIEEAVSTALGTPADSYSAFFDYDVFEQVLTDSGFMIVPIEDPTNLRFGVE